MATANKAAELITVEELEKAVRFYETKLHRPVSFVLDELPELPIQVNFDCRFCDESANVWFTIPEFRAYFLEGKFIQDAMPYVRDTVREAVIVGLCFRCADGC